MLKIQIFGGGGGGGIASETLLRHMLIFTSPG